MRRAYRIAHCIPHPKYYRSTWLRLAHEGHTITPLLSIYVDLVGMAYMLSDRMRFFLGSRDVWLPKCLSLGQVQKLGRLSNICGNHVAYYTTAFVIRE